MTIDGTWTAQDFAHLLTQFDHGYAVQIVFTASTGSLTLTFDSYNKSRAIAIPK